MVMNRTGGLHLETLQAGQSIQWHPFITMTCPCLNPSVSDQANSNLHFLLASFASMAFKALSDR